MLLAVFFYARTEQFSKSGETKIKTLDYMIAILFRINKAYLLGVAVWQALVVNYITKYGL